MEAPVRLRGESDRCAGRPSGVRSDRTPERAREPLCGISLHKRAEFVYKKRSLNEEDPKK